MPLPKLGYKKTVSSMLGTALSLNISLTFCSYLSFFQSYWLPCSEDL